MSRALDTVKAAMGRLKVFPLPSAVVLPGGTLPLHIFEPRYRAMVRAAIESDSVFAMAQVVRGHERDLARTPPLEPIVCAGVVTLHETMQDGRLNLVLTGVCRARITSELPQTQLYREVIAEALPDAAYSGAADANLRAALFELLARLPSEAAQRLATLTTGSSGGTLADVIAGSLVADPRRRFEVLRELDVGVRLDGVTSDVLEMMSELEPPKKPDGLLN